VPLARVRRVVRRIERCYHQVKTCLGDGRMVPQSRQQTGPIARLGKRNPYQSTIAKLALDPRPIRAQDSGKVPCRSAIAELDYHRAGLRPRLPGRLLRWRRLYACSPGR